MDTMLAKERVQESVTMSATYANTLQQYFRNMVS